MRESLIETLKPSEDIDWQEHPARSALLTTWTVTKWIAIGLLAAVGALVWFIFAIVFAAMQEKEFH